MIVKVSDLIGKTLASAERGVDADGEDIVVFVDTDGVRYTMGHQQDCCESVWIEDITGDLSDLVGIPIQMAEESTSNTDPPSERSYVDDSYTWTFYKVATAKGYVTIRWFGTSNGYYSESVDFVRVELAEAAQ